MAADATPSKSLSRMLWDFDFVNFAPELQFKVTELHGPVVGVLGKNGSGKTDFLRQLAFTLDPRTQIPHAPYYFWAAGITLPKIHPEDLEVIEDGTQWRIKSLKRMLTVSPGLLGRDVIPQNSQLSVLHEMSELSQNHWLADWDNWPEAAKEFQRLARVILIPHEGPNPFRRSFEDDVTVSNHLVAFIQFLNEDTFASLGMLRDLQDDLSRALKLRDTDNLYEFFVKLLSSTDDKRRFNPLLNPFFFDSDFVWSHDPDDATWVSSLEWASQRSRPALITQPHDKEMSLVQTSVDAALLEAPGVTDVEIMLSTIGEHPFNLSRVLQREVREDSMESIRSLFSRERLDETQALLIDWGILQPYVDKLGERDPGFSSHLGLYKDMVTFGFSGEANETIRVWTRRIIQCLRLSESDALLKVAIWDEPERGLHPEAIDLVAKKALSWVQSLGIKLIYATHSTVFANAATALVETKRLGPAIEVTPLPDLADDKFLELGFTKADLLLRRSCFIFVEGPHDQAVLEEFYKHELSSGRTKVLYFGGTKQLDLPNLGVVANELSSRILLVLDGGYRSDINQQLIDRINGSLSSRNMKAFSQALQELQVLVGKSTEADALHQFLGLLRESKDKMDMSRFAVFMLNERDITRYFPIRELYGPDLPYASWEEVEAEITSKGRDVQPKKYLDEKYGFKLQTWQVREAARKRMDQPLPPEFESLRKLIV